ncbi:MAG: BamA/TamA family outer membrane protein [Bacteroidota bacterium]
MDIKIILIPFFLLSAVACFCQADSVSYDPGKSFKQSDIRTWLNRKNKSKVEEDNFLLVVPLIASNPTSGFMYGAGMSYTYKTFRTDNRLSGLTAMASYSTKGLININLKSNVFAGHEKWVLNGDWRYIFSPEITYGLGTQKISGANPPGAIDHPGKNSAGQSLKYDHTRFHEIISRKLAPNFFAGPGIQYDYYSGIKDQTVSAGDTAESWHYQYSSKHGFSAQKYTTSGICFNLLYDSRDNELNAYKGYYANLNYLLNTTLLGSSKNSTMLLAEYRAFYSLDQKKRNILAFWLYGNFVTSGSVPYLALPALGYDERQRSGRGYTFGRFRGENLVYTESEYRFPISPRSGILGGVLFLNLTTTSDRENNIHLLDYLRTGYGGGLRIMLDKKSRTRFQIDGAIAQNKISFYFGVQETF